MTGGPDILVESGLHHVLVDVVKEGRELDDLGFVPGHDASGVIACSFEVKDE